MSEINTIAVIGSGVMGAGIAAHCANSGADVLLFDIVPEGEKDRTALAKNAIEKMKKADPAMLTHPRRIKQIKACNLEDDLDKISKADWIIEVVLERLDVKQELYRTLEKHRKPGCVVSSNTSTLPLNALVKGLPDSFQQDFMITHFFNPPRYMRLLELVTGEKTRDEAVQVIRDYCDVKLGKGVVKCKDTPGFIANRIGVYWLADALHHALEQKVSVETADAVMGKPAGIPKTGVFGLMDLIGIDLLPLIAESFSQTLDKKDPFFSVYKEHDVIKAMIEEGYTGRKGKGGFYRLNTDDGGKVKESKNLQNGSYAASNKPKLGSVDAARGGLRALLEYDDEGGRYAKAVMIDVLTYAASLVPEIADDITRVDEAMRLGYNWKYGPFELIDRLGGEGMTGAAWLAKELEAQGRPVPELLQTAAEKSFYEESDSGVQYLTTSGMMADVKVDEGAWTLADKKRGKKPVLKNASAAVWDVGDGILCFEFTSKMNSLDPMSLELMFQAVEEVKKNHKGLIIGNDSDNFCAGANIGFLLYTANVAGWGMIHDVIKQGQDAYMALKYAPFPVVGAPSGLALGGGCEILMHCDAVNAHAELYTGLVEVGVGIVPGWGGCKEMVYRHLAQTMQLASKAGKYGKWFALAASPLSTPSTMPALEKAFRYISTAKVAKSAEEARDMLVLDKKSQISMNRKRLLADAKELCLSMVDGYQPPETYSIRLPGKTAKVAFEMAVNSFVKSGKATAHDEVVSKAVAEVLSGGASDITEEITEQEMLDLERAVFCEMVKHPDTLARIEHMLETGKPLRN